MPITFETRDYWLRFPNGAKRFARTWWPGSATPKAILCIVPGLGEHTGRYAPLARKLVEQEIGVVSIDLHGQGLSPGWRGCIQSYEALLEDVAGLIQFARGGDTLIRTATLPVRGEQAWGSDAAIDLSNWPDDHSLGVCLYGHSMGGNLVLNTALRSVAEPNSVIASAPMLRAVHPPGPLTIRIARVLNRIAPHYRLKAPVRKEYLSHIVSETEAYERDTLVHRRVSLRLGAGLIDSGIWAIANANLLRQPCLVMHGDEDRITDPEASKQFVAAAAASGAACQIEVYPGMLHDLHRDEGREQVIARITQFALTSNG